MALKKYIVDLSRELRQNQTPQEQKLWQHLRNRKLSGLKFLRQHPIVYGGTERRPESFIADFYCAERRLVIEVDGKIHNFQKEYDQDREGILKGLGLRVLRFKNEELAYVYKVLSTILNSPSVPSLPCREGVSDPDLSEMDGGELAGGRRVGVQANGDWFFALSGKFFVSLSL